MAETLHNLIDQLPHSVAEKLGYYVYLYIDPRNDKPFYVGKGQGSRLLSHLSDVGESKKNMIISGLRSVGLSPRLEILSHDLPNEECAFRIESAVIDLFGLDDLANLVRGSKSVLNGRISLNELITYYSAEPVEIIHPVLLIRVNKKYSRGMPDDFLYDITRGVWRIGKRKAGAKFAFAVFNGIVRGVYKINSWHPAGTTEYTTRKSDDVALKGRWEFLGGPAPQEITERYLGKTVTEYFSKGWQTPFIYANC